MILLPAIDIKDRTPVRLYQGSFDTVHQVAQDALETARQFEAAGAEWIHMVDLDGACEGHPVNADIFLSVAQETTLKVELGGGIRTMADIDGYLSAGISRVILGSVALHDPALYRRAHKFALEHRAEAEKHYHVSTDPNEIPNIDLQSDAYLPEYLQLPASRQTLHIAYGLLLNEAWFKEAFFPFMAAHEEEYYAGLVQHIGRHLLYLTAER